MVGTHLSVAGAVLGQGGGWGVGALRPWVLVQWSGLGPTRDFFILLLGEEGMENILTKEELCSFPPPHPASSPSVIKTQTLSLGSPVLSLGALCLGNADKAPTQDEMGTPLTRVRSGL